MNAIDYCALRAVYGRSPGERIAELIEAGDALAANEASRQGLIDDLRAVKALRERYFSASPALGRISA